MARLNMRQSAKTSTVPAWTPKPMIRRGVLIHNQKDPVGPQGFRLTAEQILLQRVSFMWPRRVSQEGTPGALSRPVVIGENPSNHVFVDCKVEGQGDLFSDSRTTPAGIALLHSDDCMDEFCTRSLRAGPAIVIG